MADDLIQWIKSTGERAEQKRGASDPHFTPRAKASGDENTDPTNIFHPSRSP
jgi:hypothetical protein